MSRIGPVTISLVAFACVCGCTPALAAQKKAAPPPQQILATKKVFISNGGGEDGAKAPWTGYRGAPDRAHNEFYAGMKSWGRYQIVEAPGEADLDRNRRDSHRSSPIQPRQEFSIAGI